MSKDIFVRICEYPLRIASLDNDKYKIFNCKTCQTILLDNSSFSVFKHIYDNKVLSISDVHGIIDKAKLNIVKSDIDEFIKFMNELEFLEYENR